MDPLSNTVARRCTELTSITMQNIKEIHCSISEIIEKTFKFEYLIPLLIPGLSNGNPIDGTDVILSFHPKILRRNQDFSKGSVWGKSLFKVPEEEWF